jgi:hypothetical protein
MARDVPWLWDDSCALCTRILDVVVVEDDS